MVLDGLFCLLTVALAVSASVDEGSAHDLQRRDNALFDAHQPAARAARHRRHRQKRAGRCHHSKHLQSAESTSDATATWSQAVPVDDTTQSEPTTTAAWSDTAAATTWSSSVDGTTAVGTTQSPVAVQAAVANSNALTSAGIAQFTGINTGIGSWFKTNSGQDSTNGQSWCQTPYQDGWMGFAPDVSKMLANFGGDTAKAATAYCGLEARATYNGVSQLIYIVDGFDPAWVRTPGSVDLTLGAFGALFGSTTDDKNVVMQNLQWELTGNRKEEYGYMYGRNW